MKDHSRRHLHSPQATRTEIIAKIAYLRQHYHFGPCKIDMYLQRCRDITVSSPGVRRILERPNMNRLPYNQRYKSHETRWRRYENPEPGHRIQVDVKFLERIPDTRKRYYQFAVIVDCTRLSPENIREKRPKDGHSVYRLFLIQATI